MAYPDSDFKYRILASILGLILLAVVLIYVILPGSKDAPKLNETPMPELLDTDETATAPSK